MCARHAEYSLTIVNIFVANGTGGLSFSYTYLTGHTTNVIWRQHNGRYISTTKLVSLVNNKRSKDHHQTFYACAVTAIQ